jgi:hypothetical protein
MLPDAIASVPGRTVIYHIKIPTGIRLGRHRIMKFEINCSETLIITGIIRKFAAPKCLGET